MLMWRSNCFKSIRMLLKIYVTILLIRMSYVLEPKEEKSSALETAGGTPRDRKVAAGSEAATTKRWNAIPQIILSFKERARASWGVQRQFPRRMRALLFLKDTSIRDGIIVKLTSGLRFTRG